MNNRPILACLLKTIFKNILLTITILIMILLSVFVAILPPLVLEKVVDDIVLNGASKAVLLAVIYFLLIALGGVTDAVRAVFITKFGQRVTNNLRRDMIEKLTRLNAGYFVSNETGKIVSVFTNDVETIETLFKSGIINMVIDLFKIVSILAVIFYKSLGLGLVMLGVTPIIFIVSLAFRKKMRKEQLINRSAIAKINNHIPETLSSIRTIDTLNKQQYFKDRFDDSVEEALGAENRTAFFDAIYTPIISQISVLVISVMMILSALGGGYQSFFGIGVGTAVAIIAYVNKIFAPIESLGMEIQHIQSAMAGLTRVRGFLKQNEKIEQTIDSFDLSLNKEPAILFDCVDFDYGENQILNNFSLKVEAGERVAIIGRTGAGKSTIYRLILGLFSPKAGNITIFGNSADKICDANKRKIFGFIEQDVLLVEGTVKDQITLFDESISDSDVLNALKVANLYDTVASFPNGIYQPCKRSLFSQGQLQLLAVARAVVYNPHILLLDEVTSNLDAKTEELISSAIQNASKNRTILCISHKLNDIGLDYRVVNLDSFKNKENIDY